MLVFPNDCIFFTLFHVVTVPANLPWMPQRQRAYRPPTKKINSPIIVITAVVLLIRRRSAPAESFPALFQILHYICHVNFPTRMLLIPEVFGTRLLNQLVTIIREFSRSGEPCAGMLPSRPASRTFGSSLRQRHVLLCRPQLYFGG